jgi:hypothetical protein
LHLIASQIIHKKVHSIYPAELIFLHRYLVRLENSKGYAPKDTISLLILLRKSADEFGSVVKNLRVSSNAIEFDLYTFDFKKKEDTVVKLEKEFGRRSSERDLEKEEGALPDKIEVLRQSIELFNEQRYWECHETLEQIWRREPKGSEKDVEQGIILTASALVHFQKNEDDVCIGMIPKALSKLASWPEKNYYMIDVEKLKERLKEIERTRVISPFKI